MGGSDTGGTHDSAREAADAPVVVIDGAGYHGRGAVDCTCDESPGRVHQLAARFVEDFAAMAEVDQYERLFMTAPWRELRERATAIIAANAEEPKTCPPK